MDAVKKHCPELYQPVSGKDHSQMYSKMPAISIDYALMEKAANISVLKTKMDWCDMGNWDMFFEKSPLDKSKNHAKGQSFHQDSSNCLMVNHLETPLIILGLEDTVVVQTHLGTLVCKKGRAEEAALFLKKISK